MNNRFKPISDEHTNAIFTVDDDMRVPCTELSLGYEVWSANEDNLIGFMPRIHVMGTHGFQYRCWWSVWWRGAYSIILTKASFLHHKYFELYSIAMPSEIREYVDRHRNCEDLAMQFLITNATSLAPLYIKGHLSDLGALNGISTSQNLLRAGHMSQRSRCLDDLASFYGTMPLKLSHVILDSASNQWHNQPSMWWEYISSDLWKIYEDSSSRSRP